MAVSEDFGPRACLANKGVIGRHRAIVAQSQRFSHMVVELLRLHPEAIVFGAGAAKAIAIADRDVQHAVGTEVDSARQIATRFPGIGNENLLDVGKLGAAETPAGNAQSDAVAVALG